ncbi:hypothetical protein VCHENC02_5811, partial [Vibrio harveyi]
MIGIFFSFALAIALLMLFSVASLF